MGIFAKGSQFPANVEADTPQNRYGGQLTKDSVAGDALGETIGEVNATASSANTTTGELIADIEALEGRVDALENDPGPDLSGYAPVSRVSTLEGRVSTLEDNTPEPRKMLSGTGWRVFQYNGVVEINFLGVTEGWTLPEGWRPPYMKYAPVADLEGQSPTARVSVNPQGVITLWHTTGACYGSLVYLL